MSRDWALSRFGSKTALCAMAAEPEYGPALRARIRPLMTGVGPVEAASAVGHVLAELKAAGDLPDLVISLGSAGSRTLDHVRVYRVSNVAYRDMDASVLGFPKGETPFLPGSAVLPLMEGPRSIPTARLATGASVVSGVAYDGVDADMVDMETYAVVRAAARFGVPVMGLRGVSAGRTDLTDLRHWTDALAEIDLRLAEALDLLHDHFTPAATEPA